MTAQKHQPSRGPISLAHNLTAAEITRGRGDTTSGGIYYTKPITVDPEIGGFTLTGPNLARLTGNKRHFPMDGATTGCTITVQLQGRHNEASAWQNAGAVIDIADFSVSMGDTASAADQRSSIVDNSVAYAKFSQYRLKITSFSDAGDAQGASGTPGFNYWIDENSTVQSFTDSDGDIDMTPTAVTAVAQESVRFVFPPHAPIEASTRDLGRKYPVLVIIRQTSGPYNNSFPPTAPLATATDMEYEALKRGWVVAYLHVPGNNIAIGGTDAFWKTSPSFDGSTATARDARTATRWAIQWIRAFGVDAFDLDPNRIFLWGEDEGASIALFSTYDPNEAQDTTSDDALLRQPSFPNCVGARNPDVEWTVMDASLGGPLKDSSVATSAAATLGDATELANLSPARILNSKVLTTDQILRFSSIPCYLSCSNANTTVLNADTIANTDGVASWFVPTYPAPGDDDVDVQFSEVQTYIWAQAVKTFKEKVKATGALTDYSVFNTQGTPSTNTYNASLVPSNITTKAAVNADALAWAERFLGFATTEIEPQACFDFDILL